MEHSNKRLRAERNIYISAGCMFAFVVLCQIWSLIARVTDLEAEALKKETNHNLLKKQIESNKKFQEELSKDIDTASADDLRKQLRRLTEQNASLQARLEEFESAAASAENDSAAASGLRSRPAAGKKKD